MPVDVIGKNYNSPSRGRLTAPPGQVYVRDQATGTVLLRPADNPQGSSRDGGGDRPLIDAFSGQFEARTPPAELFAPLAIGQFAEEAEQRVAPFFDKDLELAMKELERARSVAEQERQVSTERLGIEQEQFFRVEDVNFGRALNQAQQGFSGRGLFTSGVRQRAIREQAEDRELGLEQAERGFAQRGEDVSRAFEQFEEKSALTEERERLRIKRERELAKLQVQTSLRQEELARRQALIEQFQFA